MSVNLPRALTCLMPSSLSARLLCAPLLALSFNAYAEPVIHEGELAEGDEQLAEGEYSDSYDFEVPANSRITIEMRSKDVDTYLWMNGENGYSFENDDAAEGDTTRSRLTTEYLPAGTYRVRATTFGAGESGAYTLTIETEELPALTLDRTVDGELAEGDGALNTGEFADTIRIKLEAGQTVQVMMTSTEIDPYIILRAPDETQVENDDYLGTDSSVVHTAAQTGTYQILATSALVGETGAYQVQVLISE